MFFKRMPGTGPNSTVLKFFQCRCRFLVCVYHIVQKCVAKSITCFPKANKHYIQRNVPFIWVIKGLSEDKDVVDTLTYFSTVDLRGAVSATAEIR